MSEFYVPAGSKPEDKVTIQALLQKRESHWPAISHSMPKAEV